MDKSCRFRFWLLELRLVEANGQLDVAPIGAIGIINIPLPAIVDGRLPEAQVQCFTPPPGMDAILREPPSPISPDVLWTPPHRGTRLKVSIEKPTCQRDPVVVYWPSGFLEAWCTKAKKRHFFKNIMVYWPCRLRRQGHQTSIFLNKCGFLALVPQASKKPLGQ